VPIWLDVNSRFDEPSARRAAEDAQRYFRDASTHIDVEARLDESSVRTAAERAHRIFADAGRDAGDDFHRNLSGGITRAASDVERASTDMASSLGKASGAASGLAGAVTQVGSSAASSSAALGPVGMAAAAMAAFVAVTDLAGIAASAAQALWLLPAAAGAAGAALGTLKLGMSGFDQALKDMSDPKKFADDLKELSPNAQQAALSIQALMPAFDRLKNATQDALFAGVGQQLNSLANQYLPMVQQLTTGIAGAFNTAFKGVTDQLLKPETQSALQTFMSNVTAAFQQLAPAAAPLAKALADIMAVGSGFLPQLAQAASQAAQAFSDFITHARESGDLKRWLGEGLDTIKQLLPVAGELVKQFMALAPIGQAVLPDIARFLKDITQIMPLIGQAALALGPHFGVIDVAVKGIKNGVDLVSSAFEAIKGVVQGVASTVVPIINSISFAVNTMLEPIRAAIGLANLVPGVNLPNIPNIPSATQTTGGTAVVAPPIALGGEANAQRERRGLPPIGPPPLPTAGLPPVPAGGYTVPLPPPPTSGGGGGGGGGSSAVPAAAATPGVMVAPTNAAAAIAYAQQASGTPYQLGGVGPQTFDCSGFISDLYAIMTGKPYTGTERYFTTASNFEALGFQPGYQSGAFNIGVHQGGPAGGHMAGTLPNNVNVEAGGAYGGVMYGGKVGARDPQFESVYHLPIDKAFNPGGPLGSLSTQTTGTRALGMSGGGPSGTQTDPIYVTLTGPGSGSGLGALGAGAPGQGGPGGGGVGSVGGLGGTFLNSFKASGGLPGTIAAAVGNIANIASGTFDGPGPEWLQPGTTVAQNNTGQPQQVLPPGMPTVMGPNLPGGGGPAPGPPGGQQGSVQYGAAPGAGPPSPGGFTGAGGGAVGAATAALGSMFPGSQVVAQLAQRAIGYMGQVAGIGIMGAMETFLPGGGGGVGDPSKSLIGRIATGFAGARPAQPNAAGKAQPPQPKQLPDQPHAGSGAPPGPGGPAGPMVVMNNPVFQNGTDGQAVARDIARQHAQYGAGQLR
jgi:phage-related protein